MREQIEQGQSLKHMESIIQQELKGKQLWGDINLSIQEYNVLRDRIKELLEYRDLGVVKITNMYPVAMTTLLVFLARYKYNTNYWGLLSKELSVSISGPMEAEIGSTLRKTFKFYGFDFSDVQNERRVYLEPILYEAGLPPESSLDDLFYILNYDSHNVFDPQLIIEDLVEMRSYQIRKPMLKFFKRFKGDRAVEFVMEVHEAMLCVEQSMTSDSRYIGNYSEWKTRERKKETISSRKKQECQTKPYLTFDNGNRGLCLVLPRVLLKNEWIEEAAWHITTEHGIVQKKLAVFGDDGKRYIDSLTVPVSPVPIYKIELIDEEDLEDSRLATWTIDGIRSNTFLMFNSNGRLIVPNYIPDPYGIIIYGNAVHLSDINNVALRYQDYPTNRPEYTVQSFESTARNGSLTVSSPLKTIVLKTRPQVNMSFVGRTLFSLDSSDDYRLYTEIPSLLIEVDDGSLTAGLKLRIGNEEIPIDSMFESGWVKIKLDQLARSVFGRYGTYSIRLYQYDHFIKLSEFTLVPHIETTYSPCISWTAGMDRAVTPKYKFKRTDDMQMEFEGCRVSVDDDEYVVFCPPGLGTIPVKFDYNFDRGSFSASLELPIRPFEFEIVDFEGGQKEPQFGRTIRVGLQELQEKNYWVSLRFLASFARDSYKLVLRSVNGIEQEEELSLVRSGCANKNLSVFYDTLQTCPLPARIELVRQGDEASTVPLLLVTDAVQLNRRPGYTLNGYVTLSISDDGKNLTVTNFRDPGKSYQLSYENSVLGKSGKTRGYRCPEKLCDGLYVIETNKEENAFEFDDENTIWLTNGNETLFVSARKKGDEIKTFSDWLDQLMKDVLVAGITHDIRDLISYQKLESIAEYKGTTLTSLDCEILIALAYLVSSKCCNAKRLSIKKCMASISSNVLNEKSRLDIIRALAEFHCPAEIFEVCMQNYHLLLFSVGSDDAISLAEEIDNYSIELSMLLRMGADDQLRNTLGREKYRELIGREALRDFLHVPDIDNREQIAEEQKRFLREQDSKVRIRLTPDISGEMEPITNNMIKVTYNKIIFDKAAKPDIGIYFDRIRYVDQYVNWYFLHAEPTWEIKPETRKAMVSVVQEHCHNIVKSFNEIIKIEWQKKTAEKYEIALKARFKGDPFSNMSAPIPARYFYLQGLAAYLAKLPREYQKYGWAIRTGESFMVQALSIAPKISRRDILMASVYLYLTRKEEKSCQ